MARIDSVGNMAFKKILAYHSSTLIKNGSPSDICMKRV